MMKLMLVPLFAVLARPAPCQEVNDRYDFGQDIRQFAVEAGHVYVATDGGLHQLRHNLTLHQRVSLSGVWSGSDVFERVSEANHLELTTFRVHVLLPFVSNRTLITCGIVDKDHDYCEIRNLLDISQVVYWEQIPVGPQWRSSASVAFVVNVREKDDSTETYIMTAVEHRKQRVSDPSGHTNTLVLLNTNDNQTGRIFSNLDHLTNAVVDYAGSRYVEFVDGFQIGAVIYFILYQHNTTKEARLLWFEGNEGKGDSLKNIWGGILVPSDAGKNATQVVASSLVPGFTPVLWVGVFAVDGEETNTQLVLFDISSDLKNRTEMDTEFHLRNFPKEMKNVSMVFS